MLADPLKETPPIVLAFSSTVAVPALPDTVPVTFPVILPVKEVAVTIPVTTAPCVKLGAPLASLFVILFALTLDMKLFNAIN
jgi:hypothetical protein